MRGFACRLDGLYIARYRVTAVGVRAVLIVVLFMTEIVGALGHPPRK